MNGKLLAIGLLVIMFLCGVFSMAVLGLVTPDENPVLWNQAAEVGASNRLMAFLAFVSFGGGCPQVLALIVCIAAFVFLMVRAARPSGGSHES